MTTFFELVHDTEWDTVIGPLRDIIMKSDKCGPDDFTLAPFEGVFNELRRLKPEPSDGILHIEHYHEEHDMSEYPGYADPETGDKVWVEDYEDVFAVYPSEHQAEHYALEFTPWEQWLGLELDRLTLDTYAPGQVLAYCLWEMTFYGFTQTEVQAKLESLVDAKERMCLGQEKTYSWEEVKAKLKKRAQDSMQR